MTSKDSKSPVWLKRIRASLSFASCLGSAWWWEPKLPHVQGWQWCLVQACTEAWWDQGQWVHPGPHWWHPLSINPKSILEYLDQRFILKPESRGPQTTCLGVDISPHSFSTKPDVYHWSMGWPTRVKKAVRNVETYLEDIGLGLTKKVSTVLPHDYKPELDVSKECNEEEVSQCHQRIRVLLSLDPFYLACSSKSNVVIVGPFLSGYRQ